MNWKVTTLSIKIQFQWFYQQEHHVVIIQSSRLVRNMINNHYNLGKYISDRHGYVPPTWNSVHSQGRLRIYSYKSSPFLSILLNWFVFLIKIKDIWSLSKGGLPTVVEVGCIRARAVRQFKFTSRSSGNHQQKPSEEDCSTQSMIKKDWGAWTGTNIQNLYFL